MGNAQSSLPLYYNADPTNNAHVHSLSGYVDLASKAVGGKVVKTSNEKFGASENLIKTSRAPKTPATAGEGPIDGWMTRRHNPEADWTVVRLGAPGSIAGFDVDTTGIDGDHAHKVSVQACSAPPDAAVDEHGNVEDAEWTEVLPIVEVSPNSHHLLALWAATEESYRFVRLNLHPDGGVARLRVFGTVTPAGSAPSDSAEIDLASVTAGATVIGASDEKLGAKENLLLPGRATQDAPETQGWKTRRSRAAEHSDWVIVRLGEPGFISRVEIDTRLYDGDQPVAAAVQACYSQLENPERDAECFWYQIVPRSEINADSAQSIDVALNDVPFSHVKLVVYPDGGVSRLRVFGQRVSEIEDEVAREDAEAAAEALVANQIGAESEDHGDADAEDNNDDDFEKISKESVEEEITVASVERVVVKTTESQELLDVASPSKKAKQKAAKGKHNHHQKLETLDQLLATPPSSKKRSRTKTRADYDTDASVNTADSNAASASQGKRSRRKSKNRHSIGSPLK